MKDAKMLREVTQYIVIYGDKERPKIENFPDYYSAALWVKEKGGYVLKEVQNAEVKSDG